MKENRQIHIESVKSSRERKENAYGYQTEQNVKRLNNLFFHFTKYALNTNERKQKTKAN